MKNLLFIILIGLSFLFILGCKNNNTQVEGNIPKATVPPKKAPVSAVKYIYGNHFRVQNSTLYETLLEVCRRCGTRRFITSPGGGTTYQRFWVSRDDPKKCGNWSSQGYMQIEFAEKKLPTKATVLIQPKYTGAYPLASVWGQPFEITAMAQPINESRGFQISVNPVDGLGGVYSLIVQSDYSNHVKQSELEISVTYGQRDVQTIIFGKLNSLKEKAVKKSPFDCNTYTN